jgi:ubiquinone/menaquinone biosynthesis C-methylase UbiE
MWCVPDDVRTYWNGQAKSFDDEPDHGLLDPTVRSAWRELLLSCLPVAPAEVVDLGCGTGSLSVLLGAEGYRVRGIDLAEEMVAAAQNKARTAGVAAQFERGDAADPPYPAESCDVVLARHVLWALPSPEEALQRWVRLLRAGGRLVLIEGRWSTGAGLSADECAALVSTRRKTVSVRHLSDPALWGRQIEDERYLLLSVA